MTDPKDANTLFEEQKRLMMPRFLEDLQKKLDGLTQALDDGDFDQILSIGHKVKGTCGMFGYTQLSEIGKKIENDANQKDTNLIAGYLAELKTQMDALKQDAVS